MDWSSMHISVYDHLRRDNVCGSYHVISVNICDVFCVNLLIIFKYYEIMVSF